MNKVDFILIIIILVPTYYGFKKGFLKSVFSLIGLIAGLVLASMFHQYLIPFIKLFIIDVRFVNLISFLIILITVYFLIIFIAIRISKINTVTKTLDRISGLLLGFMKGILVASISGMIFSSFNIFSDSSMNNSYIYPKIENITPVIYKYISNNFNGDKINNDFEKLIPKESLKK